MDLAHRTAALARTNQRVALLLFGEADSANHFTLRACNGLLALLIHDQVCVIDLLNLVDAIVLWWTPGATRMERFHVIRVIWGCICIRLLQVSIQTSRW